MTRLAAMFFIASGLRAFLSGGLTLPGGFAVQTAAGSNLLITGSVATVICRRLAREGGAPFSVWRLTAVGVVLLPAQILVAHLGLRLTGAI